MTSPDYLHEYEHLTLVRLLLAQHRAATTARHRSPVRCSACSTGCTPRPPTPGGTAACSRSACCRPSPTTPTATVPQALAAWAAALAEAPEPDSYVRLFLDEGAPMLALLHARRRVTEHGDDARAGQARRLLERAPAPSRRDRAAAVAWPTR